MPLQTFNKPKWSFVYGAVFLIHCSACKKFLQVEPAPNLVESEAVFASDQTAVSSVTGLFSQLVSSNLSITNGGSSVFLGLTADELNNNANPIYDEFQLNAISRTNFYVNNLWSNAYKNIYQVNAILKGLEGTTKVTDSVKTRLTGEAKFVRAFYYFYLLNFFGDVPFVSGTVYTENAVMPRTSIAELYSHIISDLEEAKNLMPASYSSSDRVRPNKWTAAALLARTYLYINDWENAAANATAVINAGPYSLETDLNQVFAISSTETLWQLMRENANTAEGTTFIPFSTEALPTLSLQQILLDAFEKGDQRETHWVNTTMVDGQGYYYPFKYKARGSGSVTEYLVVLRLAEQYLIRSEAQGQQNDISGALEDLNRIRYRAGLADTLINTKATLLEAIAHERRVELFAEWGHRWFDLKRTGQIDAVLGTEKSPNWQPSDALFPLPQEEIERNVALTQNPGY